MTDQKGPELKIRRQGWATAFWIHHSVAEPGDEIVEVFSPEPAPPWQDITEQVRLVAEWKGREYVLWPPEEADDA